MSKPRRGTIAAGLAVAVVASLGAWTLRADADEVAAPPPAPESTEAAVDRDTPPPLTVFGEPTKPNVIGAPGTSSDSLAASGAAAAPPDRSGRKIRAKYGPKGYTSKKGNRNKSRTAQAPVRPAPPKPMGVASQPVSNRYDVNYHYANAIQNVSSVGAGAKILIPDPDDTYLAPNDYHTLAEISVHSPDNRYIVEVGWMVNRAVNEICEKPEDRKTCKPSDEPHLFVYHWVDGKETCYNGCGWVPREEATVKVGYRLPSNVQMGFGIQNINGDWWVQYGSEWIGKFPGELFGGNFTKTGQVQWFGEVASSSPVTCSDMGNGLTADDPSATRFLSMLLLNGEAVNATLGTKSPQGRDKDAVFTIQPVNNMHFRFGGPGIKLDDKGEVVRGTRRGC